MSMLWAENLGVQVLPRSKKRTEVLGTKKVEEGKPFTSEEVRTRSLDAESSLAGRGEGLDLQIRETLKWPLGLLCFRAQGLYFR